MHNGCHVVVSVFINHMHKVGKKFSFYNISSLLHKNQEIVKRSEIIMVIKDFKILLSSGIELGTPGWEVQTYPTEPSGMPHERVDF